MTRPARLLRLTAWIVGIGFVLLALATGGHGALSPPPLGSPSRWQAWFEQREPAIAAFALLRMAAVGACWYIAATTVVGTVLRVVRADVLVAVADAFTVAPIRRLLAGSLTLTLAGIGPTATLAVAQPAPATTSAATSTAEPAAGTTDTITMRRLPPPGAEPDAPVADPPSVRSTERWTVESGDCFWTIADDLLQRAWGRAPTDAEIVPYWLSLIEANRTELADPGNPDLIFPDQVFSVPPVLPVADRGE